MSYLWPERFSAWLKRTFARQPEVPVANRRLSIELVSNPSPGSSTSRPFTPFRPAHQPLPVGPASPYAENAGAAFRLILLAQEPTRPGEDNQLSTAIRDEALKVASFVLAPLSPRVVLARQHPSEMDAAHPFIRVCATSRDTKFFTALLPLYAIRDIEYPPQACIEMNSVISVWVPGKCGPKIVGCVRNMQPASQERIILHLADAEGRLVGFLDAPSHVTFEPDRESQAAEYASSRTLTRLPSAAPLPLPQHGADLYKVAQVGELLLLLEGAPRPFPPIRRMRSGTIVPAPVHPAPTSQLPPVPWTSMARSHSSDADSTVHSSTHPPHTEATAGL